MNDHFDNYYGKGEASHDRKSMIDGFIDFASQLNIPVAEFPKYISTLDPTRGAPTNQQITLSTIHKTKGLEFDYIFIPSCLEGFMPCLMASEHNIFDKRNPKKQEEVSLNIENERRLFYVALTRAKKVVYLATVTSSKEISSFLPSRFIEEILFDECSYTLKNISKLQSASEEGILQWLELVKKHAGRKSLIRNIEKYLIKLELPNLQQEVARINASATEAPFKYELVYKNLGEESTQKNEEEPPEKNYWDDVQF